MDLVSLTQSLFVGALLCACCPVIGAGQVCQMPDSVRSTIPSEAPITVLYAPLRVTGEQAEAVPLGVGHVHYSDENPVLDLPPGGDDWLRRIELPLSPMPGAPPSAWIGSGWILRSGETPALLATDGLVETDYEEVSLIVLENRSDGWLHIRYAAGVGDTGTAWTPSCALSSSPAKLDFTAWDQWFLLEQIAPLFFRADTAGDLRSEPFVDAPQLAAIGEDYILEPLEVRGEWMRVLLKEPSDYCDFEVTPALREGWIRWRSSRRGPLVWYFTRGC